MDQPNDCRRGARLVAAGLALALAAPIGVAARLTPDPRGWGTHEQLGSAPCWFRVQSGRPCPTCGMTTAWAYAVRGDARAAVDANLGGVLLLAAFVAGAAWLGAVAATGRALGGWLTPRRAAWIGAAWLVATIGDWVRRLAG